MTPRGQFFFHRTLSRMGLLVMTVALTLLGIRLGWGWLAEKRLADARRALAQGDLPLPLAMATVDESQNAAAELVAAVEDFQPMAFRPEFGPGGGGGGMFSPVLNEFAWPEPQRRALRAALTANAETFRQLDLALTRPQVAWEMTVASPPGTPTLADKLRGLEEMILATAVVARLEGRDREAVEALERLMGIDRIVTACPAAEAQQQGSILRSRIVTYVERFGGGMAIETAGTPNRQAAPAAAIRRLIAALIHDGPFRDQLVLACERQMLRDDDNARWRMSDTGFGRMREERDELENWWLRPLRTDERRRQLDSGARWLPVVAAERFDAFRAMPTIRRAEPSNLTLMVEASSKQADFRWNSLVQQRFRAVTEGRAAAVLLAARWAQADLGTAPATAEMLVPAYLPMRAMDPFAVDERPLRYRLDPLGPTVWSVGSNGVDEDGLVAPLTRGRSMEQPDLVYGAAWQAMRVGFGGPGGGFGGGFGGGGPAGRGGRRGPGGEF